MLRRSVPLISLARAQARTPSLANEAARADFATRVGPNAAARSLSRGISTSPSLARRDDDRLPQGHVRPRRRTRPSQPSQTPYGSSDPPTGPGFAYSGAFGADGYDADSAGSVPPSRPVIVPADPQGVLSHSHAAHELLAHDTLVIVRQLEMLNVFMGFEQANRYAIHTTDGQLVGFLAEQEQGIISTISRQALRTHRPFRSVVMDRTGKPILWIRRPFAFINSRIFVHSSEEQEGQDGRIVGEAQQQWHPWRRKYNLFQSREGDGENYKQFAAIDGGLFAWDFWLKDRDDRLIASINRNFRGLGREIFTDTGQYVIRFDSAGTELDLPPGAGVSLQGQSLVLPSGSSGGLTLDQRAMTLATAVSIDFDYFSRHSGSGGMGFPFIFWGGGDGSSEARGGDVSTPDAAGTAAGAAGAGAAGAMGAGAGAGGRELSEDEQIYGPQQGRGDDGPMAPGGEGYDTEAGWGQEDPWQEELQDPWAQDDGFGGGDGGGGGGDWGDWS